MYRYLPKTARTLGIVDSQTTTCEPKLDSVQAAVAFIDVSGFVSSSYRLEYDSKEAETGTGESVRREDFLRMNGGILDWK